MNWEIVGATGEWAGALAVVLTLFYLARQISQANRISIAEAERGWFNAWHQIVRSLSSDVDIASTVQRGLSDYRSLAPPERATFHGRIAGIINHTDLARRLSLAGLISKDIVDATMDICISIVITDGGSVWWEEAGTGFPMHHELQVRLAEDTSNIQPFNASSVWRLDEI